MLLHNGIIVLLMILSVVNGGRMKISNGGDDYQEILDNDESGGSCSRKEILDREKAIKVLNAAVTKKLKELEKLENRRRQLLKLIKKLCNESNQRAKKLAQTSSAMNHIYIQFYGDKVKSPDGRIMIPKENDDNAQMELLRKIIAQIYEKSGKPESAKINLDQLKWTEILRPYENIDFTKITKEELELILHEVLEISKCPVGKIYDVKKKKCVDIIPSDGMFSIKGIFKNKSKCKGENKKDEKKVKDVFNMDKLKKKIEEKKGKLEMKIIQEKPPTLPEISNKGDGASQEISNSDEKSEATTTASPKTISKDNEIPKLKLNFERGKGEKILKISNENGGLKMNVEKKEKPSTEYGNLKMNLNFEKGEKSMKKSNKENLSLNLEGEGNSMKIKEGSMELTTRFHPEIHYPNGSGSKKLTPVAVTGSKNNMDKLMMKIVELAKDGKSKDISALIEETPELRGKFKINTEKEENQTTPKDLSSTLEMNQKVKIKSEEVQTTPKSITTIQVVDEGEIPIVKRENLTAKIEFDPSKFVAIKSDEKIEIQPEMKIIQEKLPSKIILKATLPSGEVVNVGERNLTNEALLNSNGTLTLDKLGLDLKNVSMSNELRESLSSMKLDVKNEQPMEIKIQTKKIQPAKFVQKAPVNFGKRSAEAETTTEKIQVTTGGTTVQSTTTINAIQSTEEVKTTTNPPATEKSTEKAGKLFSTIFKPVKEAMNKNKEKIQRLLGLNDQDQRRFMDIPASNKEDIDKILKEKPANMEFKSVLGKTLDDVGTKGLEKMLGGATESPVTST